MTFTNVNTHVCSVYICRFQTMKPKEELNNGHKWHQKQTFLKQITVSTVVVFSLYIFLSLSKKLALDVQTRTMSRKWNPTIFLSCPSLPAAAVERLPHPVWAASLWPLVLIVCTKKESVRDGGGREGGEMGDGLSTIPPRKRGSKWASSSSSLWQLIPRLSSSLTSCGGGGAGGGGAAVEEERNVHPQQNWVL